MGATARAMVASGLVLAACGRGDLGAAVGGAGGRCYGNHTCDDGLLCSDEDLCVGAAAFDCATAACSGHGRCQGASGAPRCVCDSGYRAVGLACVACTAGDCAGSGVCPSDMVWVPYAADGMCVDAYEDSIFERPDCTGARYGAFGFADLPAGFPVNVECSRCDLSGQTETTSPASVELYACSLPGLRPAAFVSWYQAQRACENAGKQLCDDFVLGTACAGPAGHTYPYGDTFVDGVCNVSENAAFPTGSSGCEGGFPGLFDMVGNVKEWSTTSVSTNQPQCHGGGFNSGRDADDDCGASAQSGYSLDQLSDVGFRCCRAGAVPP